LNLFAYTGGSTLACAKAGAKVTHVDASKTSVTWAKENLELSGLGSAPVRWMVEDVQDFVAREVRRGNTYQGFILDPPSYGRGPKKQVWKIEKDLMPLLQDLKKLAAEDFLFCLLSSHSQGYTPIAHENQLRQIFGSDAFQFRSGEMLLDGPQGLNLPAGTFSFLYR
jgi:23S rRNA (cytosine1962-C5)-methyltransferase